MITSSVPSEGKSTLAVNLAIAMSELERVVLVEVDMRRPGLSRALGLTKYSGLQQILSGQKYVEDTIVVEANGALDVIPAGKGRMTGAPGKLLASPEFAELIEILKVKYDRIILDMPPVEAVSDALVVGKHANAAIYVVKADSTPLPTVKSGIQRLKVKGIDVLGVVISQVDFEKVASYGGDYYYPGHTGYGDYD
jgi:capsular exopolysaccharide synthesis family protein